MKNYLIYFILFFHMAICFGCRNEQKKEAYAENSTPQKVDTINVVIDKSILSREEILSWDYDQAITKLGEPISRSTFPMTEISEFTIELLNLLPEDPDIQVKELTFEADAEMYLTIWYIEKDEQWAPVHFMKYNKYSQF